MCLTLAFECLSREQAIKTSHANARLLNYMNDNTKERNYFMYILYCRLGKGRYEFVDGLPVFGAELMGIQFVIGCSCYYLMEKVVASSALLSNRKPP